MVDGKSDVVYEERRREIDMSQIAYMVTHGSKNHSDKRVLGSLGGLFQFILTA